MKTILAASDFSASSVNACLYAAMLAKKLSCKLVLFNLYEVPAMHSNSGLYLVSFNLSREAASGAMENLLKQVKTAFPRLKVESLSVTGSFKYRVEEFISKHRVQAVVIGLATKTRINKYIFGSHSTDIAGKVDAPVIVVPEQFKNHTLQKIILGVDNVHQLKGSAMKQFSDFALSVKENVHAVHIRTQNEVFTPGKEIIKAGNKKLEVETYFAKDLGEGVRRYAHTHKGDLVAVVSGSHSAIYNFFMENNTKKIAFASKIPVMAIHE